MRIYKVEFREMVKADSAEAEDWGSDTLTVAAENAEDAIAKVRKDRLNATRDWTDEDVEPPVKHEAFVESIDFVQAVCTGSLDL